MVITPLEALLRSILSTTGLGLITVSAWSIWVIWLTSKRSLRLFKTWRYIAGFGLLSCSTFPLLSYFEADLPLIGTHTLGGYIGIEIRGSDSLLGILRVALLIFMGLYLIFPKAIGKIVLTFTKGIITSFLSIISYGYYRYNQTRNPLGRQMQQHFTNLPKRSNSVDLIPSEPEASLTSLGNSEDLAFISSRNDDEYKTIQSPSVPTNSPRAKIPSKSLPVQLPSVNLLSPAISVASISNSHQVTASLIEDALAEHGVEVSVAEIRPGPSVTMFGLVPGWNRKARFSKESSSMLNPSDLSNSQAKNRVKVDSILAREKDLALALAAPSLRIEAPVPGESVVGVEVPNKDSTLVTIRTVMESQEYQEKINSDSLPVALGLASAGEPITIDLLKMPHLLIAGATGSGKSVCINTIISSLISHQPPEKVRMLLVDPKRVELTPYNGIPHLVTPVVVDADRVVKLLRGAIQEMLRRYKLLERAGVRNIQSYNNSAKREEDIPYFVICIDELADLMMTASFEVEQSICRLAQLGRATGIHLIVATQRPSVDVVTGLIKANFPSRISFAVASQVDSRTILDTVGAERLLGRGDMLFLSADSPKARRIQGVFISEQESESLSEHWRQQSPNYELIDIPLEELAREAEIAQAEQVSSAEFDENDSLYDRVMKLAANDKQLSTSLIQRKLRIGYPRAARLMDQLEEQGIVSSTSEPGKARDVIYIPDQYR